MRFILRCTDPWTSSLEVTYSFHAVNNFNKNTPIYRAFRLLFPCPWRLLQNVTMDTGFLCDKEAGLRETTKEALCLIVDRRMQDDILVVSGEVVLELCHIRTTRIDAKKRRDLARGISTPAPLHHMSLSPGPHPRARPTLLTIRHRPDSCSLPDHFVQL